MLALVAASRAAMPQRRSPSRPTLSGVAVGQPSPTEAGFPQARLRWPMASSWVCAAAADAANRKRAARPRRRNALPPSRMRCLHSLVLRRRRDRDFHRWPLQHLLMESIELRIGLAPAAIGKAEVGIAEHADQADLRDIE